MAEGSFRAAQRRYKKHQSMATITNWKVTGASSNGKMSSIKKEACRLHLSHTHFLHDLSPSHYAATWRVPALPGSIKGEAITDPPQLRRVS